MTPVQHYQAGASDLTSAMFQRRYEPNFAWGNALSGMQFLLHLRGLWAMSNVDETFSVHDMSAQGRVMSNVGVAPFGCTGLYPYVDLDGATQWLQRADEAGLDITGALTMGGWFEFDDIASAPACMAKWQTSGDQRSYALTVLATGAAQAVISQDGTAATIVTCPSTAGDIAVGGGWYFLAMRYYPSTELCVWVNRVKYQNTVGIPAGIYNSNAPLMIGGINGAASLNGRATLCFLSAGRINDATIRTIYEQTRALFDVGFEV